MFDVKLDNGKYISCINCNKKKDSYRKMYEIIVGDGITTKINICSECMSILVSKMTSLLQEEVLNNNNKEVKI